MQSDELIDACGSDPSEICRWVFEETGSRRNAELADWLINRPLRIVLIVAVAFLVNALARRAIRRLVDRLVRERTADSRSPLTRLERSRAQHLVERAERARQRTVTMGAVLRSVASFAVFVVALLLCLGELGIDLAPLIAGAGIAGVAIGFGAQSLVRDVLAGMFIVIEDQYGVGDTVDLGDAKGTVERVTLRTTMVRDLEGTLWVVPNGEIKRVANKSQLWARAVVDLRIPNTIDLEAALAMLRTRAAAIIEASPRALEAPEVLGVESFVDGAVVVRVTAKTEPGAQFQVARALRAGLKEAIDQLRANATSATPPTASTSSTPSTLAKSPAPSTPATPPTPPTAH